MGTVDYDRFLEADRDKWKARAKKLAVALAYALDAITNEEGINVASLHKVLEECR